MIYLIRHGQTDANVNNIWQGQSGDGPINAVGRTQAEQLAIYLSDKDIKNIYSSDLVRAKQTAEVISERLDLDVEVDPLIREMSYGEFEGLDTDEIEDEYEEVYTKWLQQPQNTAFPGGESFKDLSDRANNLIQKYFYKDENTVLVSHGDMIRAIITIVSGKTSEFHLPNITNTSITTFVVSDGKIFVKDIADTPHLQ